MALEATPCARASLPARQPANDCNIRRDVSTYRLSNLSANRGVLRGIYGRRGQGAGRSFNYLGGHGLISGARRRGRGLRYS